MYQRDPFVNGFPGKSASHGAFGWSSVHLLRGHGRTILVETGPPAYIPLISAALECLELTTDDVTDILLTHSHWDHLSNIMMFPKAQVWIGADELAWARSLPRDAPFMSSLHIAELHGRGSAVSRIADGDEILPGITVMGSPGHTPGHLCYAVDTDTGPMIFAGDAVKNLYELATATVDSTLDARASRTTIARLREYMQAHDAVLVPGHDVPLQLHGDTVTRLTQQRAQISFFPSATGGEEDRTISDGSG